ncbi:MAG TPA: calcium-binding protein [Baekduia sp.]|nr:calcium-binding protein [Baekduia sp.]
MSRKLLVALLLSVMSAVGGAVPAQAQTSAPFFNCRASAVYASVAGNDRIEPIVANGNPRTGDNRNPDFALCADGDGGLGSTLTQLGIPPELLSARTANALTSIDPDNRLPAEQKVRSEASVEDLKLPLGSGTVILGVAAANSSATVSCVGTTPQLAGTSELTGLTLGGRSITLDRLITALTDALKPLGPIVEITPNEQVRDATSLTVRALHVKVLRDAGDAPLVDVVVAESRVVAPAGVCVRPSGGTAGDDDRAPLRPCPVGATLDGASGLCVVRGEGPGGKDIIIGLPFQGPSGGRVDSLRDALKRYPDNPCLTGDGPGYVILGTAGDDRITGTNGSDRILALGGNDKVSGGRGDDCLHGGSGRDVLGGTLGADRVYGASGKDALNGGSNNDYLSGGADHDTINGGYGADVVRGGGGADFINVATAGRRANVSCGSGRDKVRFNYDERATVRTDCEVRYQIPDRPRP